MNLRGFKDEFIFIRDSKFFLVFFSFRKYIRVIEARKIPQINNKLIIIKKTLSTSESFCWIISIFSIIGSLEVPPDKVKPE